jgi:hypothetical protein
MIDPASSRTGMMGNKNNGMIHVKVCGRDSREKAGMDVGVGKKDVETRILELVVVTARHVASGQAQLDLVGMR